MSEPVPDFKDEAREVYAYWKRTVQGSRNPSFSFFENLLRQGFEKKAIIWMIEAAANAGANDPTAYFQTVCEDKAKCYLYTEEAILCNEKKYEEAQKGHRPRFGNNTPQNCSMGK